MAIAGLHSEIGGETTDPQWIKISTRASCLAGERLDAFRLLHRDFLDLVSHFQRRYYVEVWMSADGMGKEKT